MADIETPTETPNFTHAWVRRIELKIDSAMEVLTRHETRLGRVERDIHEVKGDAILIENRMLNNMNSILHVVERTDETASPDRHGGSEDRLASIAIGYVIDTPLERIERKLDELRSTSR